MGGISIIQYGIQESTLLCMILKCSYSFIHNMQLFNVKLVLYQASKFVIPPIPTVVWSSEWMLLLFCDSNSFMHIDLCRLYDCLESTNQVCGLTVYARLLWITDRYMHETIRVIKLICVFAIPIYLLLFLFHWCSMRRDNQRDRRTSTCQMYCNKELLFATL